MPAPGAGKKLDCGRHGMLTAREAGKIAGVSPEVIRNRVARGWTGDDLCKPPHGKYRITREKPRFSTMLIALKLARELDDFETVPSPERIRRVHPMSIATARRWRQTFARAMRELK